MTEPVERGVPKSVKRRTFWNRVLIVGLLLLVVAALIVAGFGLAGQRSIHNVELEIRAGQQRAACRTQLQADFESAVGEALNAPPAPNPLRDQAVRDIASSADRLKRSAQICP